MSGIYCKLTSSCVSFTIHQQCHGAIEGDVAPISPQYQTVHWVNHVTSLKFEIRKTISDYGYSNSKD